MPDTWIGRRVAFTLRRWGLRGLAVPVDSESLGVRFRLHPFDNVCEKRILFTPQYFDARERTLLTAHMERAGAGAVFIDIGANIGGYSLFVARHAPGCTVLAVEPQPEVFDRLTANIRNNPGGRVKAVACAVADRDGEATMFLDHRNRGESGLKIVRPDHSGGETITVPVSTLRSLLEREDISRIDALKVDVEGAEDLILEPFFAGAPQSMWPGMVIMENARMRWHVDLIQMLEARGYRVKARTKLKVVLARD